MKIDTGLLFPFQLEIFQAFGRFNKRSICARDCVFVQDAASSSSGKRFENMYAYADVEHSRMTIICILNLFSFVFFDQIGRLKLMAPIVPLPIYIDCIEIQSRCVRCTYISFMTVVSERVLHVIYILHASITTLEIHIDCV